MNSILECALLEVHKVNSEDALGIQLSASHWHLIRRGSGPAFFFAVSKLKGPLIV